MNEDKNVKRLCIYHGNCADGFGAAYAVWKRYGNEVEFHAGVYQDSPPDVTGKDVILVDFSYKRAVLEEMAKTARTITILDHHKSAADDLCDYQSFPDGTDRMYMDFISFAEKAQAVGVLPIRALFDMNRSGAVIAWQYFHPERNIPLLLAHIQDRDLWRFLLSNTREIQACVFSHPYDFHVWDALILRAEDDAEYSSMVSEGKAIERKHFKDIDELLKVVTTRMVIGGYDVPVANLPYTMCSDAGHKLAHGEPFAACYYITQDVTVFGLRSVEGGIDVSEIAKKYGGGGHKHAAGFRLPKWRVAGL